MNRVFKIGDRVTIVRLPVYHNNTGTITQINKARSNPGRMVYSVMLDNLNTKRLFLLDDIEIIITRQLEDIWVDLENKLFTEYKK